MVALETIYKTENNSGEYGCGDLGISTNDWIELLKRTTHLRTPNYG